MHYLIDCKEYVEIRKEELKSKVSNLKRKPKLCVIQIGDDAASNSYVRGKERDCLEVGIEFEHLHIKNYDYLSELGLIMMITSKNEDENVDGIIVQLPMKS